MTPKTASLSVAFWRQLIEEKARSRRASSLGEVTQFFNIATGWITQRSLMASDFFLNEKTACDLARMVWDS